MGVTLGIVSILFQETEKVDINAKIMELEEVKKSLSTLNSYIDTQQKNLKRLSTEKVLLENEKERIKKILEIDKEKLNSLLEYQIIQDKSRAWIELLISFFIGVLSSSFVTFVAISIQSRRKNKKSKEIEK